MVLSPQFTFRPVTDPSGSAALIVSDTVVPVGAVVGDWLKLIDGGRSVTVSVVEDVAVSPALSVALTVTVYVPACAYEWPSPVALPVRAWMVPSPHETVIVDTVPSGSDAEISSEISVPVGELVVEGVSETIGGLSVMWTVCEVDAVRVALSVTTRVIV